MYDYRRFSLSSLSSTVSPTETSVISVFPTPTEKDFLLFRLENSNKRLIEQWKQCKKEVGEKIVDLWSYKQCVGMWMWFTSFMATIEVYQCFEIRGMDEALRNSVFVVETLIFLFPIGYLYWQERQEKSKMRANNKNVENAEEIKEVVFDLEKAENEEYLEFYKDQLEWFNSVKLKEISSLEEEIRRMDNRGFRWNITAMGIFVLSVWIVFIHSVLIYLHSPPCAKVKVDPLPCFCLTFGFTLDFCSKICIRRCGYYFFFLIYFFLLSISFSYLFLFPFVPINIYTIETGKFTIWRSLSN